ncbi:hypothetical protein [Herbidospora cretacea]|uniref:hypothetical protein n=1 Tax=Herbidospora cretacea TaxID=28444 RepID=UPI0007736674|nr:hypothetical protein [Herbidospora cretacea]
MTYSARGADRSAIQFASAIRDRTLAALGQPPSTAIIHQIAEEIHAGSPQTSRLKCTRLANGWTVEEAIERFHDMCDRAGVKRRGLSERSWREWEAGARPDREYTDLLCRLFETGPVQLGFARDYTPEEARRAHPAAGAADPVEDAAREASEHAEEVENSELGAGALERLRTQVVWVGRRYVWESPLPLFVEMRVLQEQTRKALDRRIHPGQAQDLYFLTGALCGLMANASMDMGRRLPADTLARAAWTYGRIAGHKSLMGWSRGMQASVALWDRRYEDSFRYAGDALTHLDEGSGGARLHMLRARSAAMLGRTADARESLRRAEEARARGGRDELHDEIGGEFAFRPAKQHYYAAVTHLHLGDAPRAIQEAGESIALYSADERENRSYGCEAMARAHLAIACVMEDDQEGAEQAVAPLLELPPDRRIDSLGATLAASRSLVSDRMARQIEGFCSVGLTHTLAASDQRRLSP